MRYSEIFPGPGKWRRLQIRRSGQCYFAASSGRESGTYELGFVTTGRSRVHAGVFIQVATPDGATYRVYDPQSFVVALRGISKLISDDGWFLEAVGLETGFHQTGLTAGTEWGYHPRGTRALNIFEVL